MKKIVMMISIVLSIVCCTYVFALDWKNVHEEADSLTVARALLLQQADPDNQEKLYELGLVYLNEHDNENAKKTFKRILDRDNSSVMAQWGLAECASRSHRYNDSEQVLRRLIKMSPDFSPAYITLAYQKYMQKDFNEAARLIWKVIKERETHVDISDRVRAYGLFAGAKGMIAFRGGPFLKVINGRAVLPYLRKAQALQPDSALVAYGLGSYYMLSVPVLGRNLKTSEEYLLRSIQLDKKFPDPYVRLAQLYRYQGNIQGYRRYLEAALGLDPQNEFALDVQKGGCSYACLGKE